MFGLACLLATFSTIGDILDGQVARLTNTGSDRGELLDAAVDRYTEFAFLAGLAIYFRDSVALMLLTMAALLRVVHDQLHEREGRGAAGQPAARPDAPPRARGLPDRRRGALGDDRWLAAHAVPGPAAVLVHDRRPAARSP